jgi:hypothetical protein
MDFMFACARPGDCWAVSTKDVGNVCKPDTVKALKGFSPEGNPIPLTPDNVERLRALLPMFDFTTEFTFHHIGQGKDFLMVGYDNLTCCWVSKCIKKEAMLVAAEDCDFDFRDTIS